MLCPVQPLWAGQCLVQLGSPFLAFAAALKVPLALQEVGWGPQEGHQRELSLSEAVQEVWRCCHRLCPLCRACPTPSLAWLMQVPTLGALSIGAGT